MDIKNLLGKSLFSLNMEELRALLNYYEKDHITYFEKIESVNKAIRRLETKQDMPVQRPQWELDALEYIALTEKWESYGAFWKVYNDWKTQWFYNGICFYEWWSKDISKNLAEARKADTYFNSLIENEKAI